MKIISINLHKRKGHLGYHIKFWNVDAEVLLSVQDAVFVNKPGKAFETGRKVASFESIDRRVMMHVGLPLVDLQKPISQSSEGMFHAGVVG